MQRRIDYYSGALYSYTVSQRHIEFTTYFHIFKALNHQTKLHLILNLLKVFY